MIKKNGFILLEVLIASAVSAFVLTALYSVLSQTNLSVGIIERITTIDMRAFLLQNQLERDLSGAFVIYERKLKTWEQKDSEKNVKKDVSVAGQKGNEKLGAGAQVKKEQYEDVPLKKVFFSKNSGDIIEVLTFITNNPLKSFTNEKAKPLIARVVYKLVRDNQQVSGIKSVDQVSFKLFRQESESLSFDEFEKIKPISYEVVKNIKKMSVEYTVAFRPEKEKDKKDGLSESQESQKKEEPEKEEKVQYKTFKTWTEAEIKSTKKQRPDICKFMIEFWDDAKKTYRTFEFKIYIYQQDQKEIPKKAVNTQINANINVNIIANKDGSGKNTNSRNNNIGARNNAGNNSGKNNSTNMNNRRKPSIFDVFLTGKR